MLDAAPLFIAVPDCGFDVYKRYVMHVEEPCLGPLHPPAGDGDGGHRHRVTDRGSKGVGKLITKISQISQSDLAGLKKPSTPSKHEKRSFYLRSTKGEGGIFSSGLIWLKNERENFSQAKKVSSLRRRPLSPFRPFSE